MNKITILTAATCLSLMAMPLYADDAHHPEKAQKMTGAKTAPAKSAKEEEAAAQHIKPAQETMRKLQDQMGKIRQAKDPGERQKLMQEHMQTMQEGMKHLRGMGGMKMMDMGQEKQGGMMMGDGMMKMHDMMKMRMEMMEMMMEQMMQREEMRDSMPKK